MRKTLAVVILHLVLHYSFAQNTNYDSLKNLLALSKSDTEKFNHLQALGNAYVWSYPDSSLKYIQEMFLVAKNLNSDELLSRAYVGYCWFYVLIGDYPHALNDIQQSLKAAERSGNILRQTQAYATMEYVYEDWGDYSKALTCVKTAFNILHSHWKPSINIAKTDTVIAYQGLLLRMGSCYEKLNQFDSALKYIRILDSVDLIMSGKTRAPASYELGNIYLKKKDFSRAIQYYQNGIGLAAEFNIKKDLIDNYNGLAIAYKITGDFDSSIYYAGKVLETGKSAHHILAQLKALSLLSEIYRSKQNTDSVAKYLELTLAAKDSLFSQTKIMQVQSLTFNEQIRQKELEQREQQLRDKIKLYALLLGLLVFLVVASILYRNNRQKQKAYLALQKQKQETDFQKSKVEHTLEELKTTQAHLIQSEKMASLGELTAGIAHEIQNPLNFVNNFSEVNTELLTDLDREIEKGNLSEIKKIASTLRENEEKIVNHGQRADGIVKGMLLHSRNTAGQKEPTDINALADEYLRLSYHGIRAKHKSFIATIQTEFDKGINKFPVVPQDIGRVLLNLYNNAFYSMMEKTKLNHTGYQPTISVATSSHEGNVNITVKDNGIGIPMKIKDKIFQPFFTTKPTGSGPGLGLSLSYDIITKEHGGEIKVESQEGEGAEFILRLPV